MRNLILFTLSIVLLGYELRSQECHTVAPLNPTSYVSATSNMITCVDDDVNNVFNNSYTVPAVITVVRNSQNAASSGWNVNQIPIMENDISNHFLINHDINIVFEDHRILANNVLFGSSDLPDQEFDVCGKLNIYVRTHLS